MGVKNRSHFKSRGSQGHVLNRRLVDEGSISSFPAIFNGRVVRLLGPFRAEKAKSPMHSDDLWVIAGDCYRFLVGFWSPPDAGQSFSDRVRAGLQKEVPKTLLCSEKYYFMCKNSI